MMGTFAFRNKPNTAVLRTKQTPCQSPKMVGGRMIGEELSKLAGKLNLMATSVVASMGVTHMSTIRNTRMKVSVFWIYHCSLISISARGVVNIAKIKMLILYLMVHSSLSSPEKQCTSGLYIEGILDTKV